MTYDLGNQLRLATVLTDLTGTAADPTVVTCTLRKPDNTTSSLTPTKDSTGHYHADFTPDQDGSWYVRWAGTGALIVAVENTFFVNRQRV